jgi:hypothetical protein
MNIGHTKRYDVTRLLMKKEWTTTAGEKDEQEIIHSYVVCPKLVIMCRILQLHTTSPSMAKAGTGRVQGLTTGV